MRDVFQHCPNYYEINVHEKSNVDCHRSLERNFKKFLCLVLQKANLRPDPPALSSCDNKTLESLTKTAPVFL